MSLSGSYMCDCKPMYMKVEGQCICAEGYKQEGDKCVDVDECADAETCSDSPKQVILTFPS